MTQVVYPSLRLSANGATALLDTVDHGIRVCDLPRGHVRWNLREEGDPRYLALSASGNTIAWLGENDSVTILTDAGRTTRALPAARDRIRAIAIADTGNRVAVLIAAGAMDSAAAGEARLVILPSDADDETLAAIEVPVYDRGFILANEDCSLLVVESSRSVGDQSFSGAYVLDGDALRPLWSSHAAPVPHGALAVFDDWIFAARSDELTGRRRTGESVSLPGSMREQMIFSRDGRHLLAYRVEDVIEVTSAHTLFRLFDLTSLQEVRRTTHLIEHRQDALFVLDDRLGLFDVRATRTAELSVNELGWENP